MIFSFARPGENEISEVHAFPADLTECVKNSVQLIAPGEIHAPMETNISVRIDEKLLHIPYRVYYEKQRILKSIDSPGEIGLVALCLGTRHYDGFIREKCLRRLLAFDENWTTPFVVQLLGEYVIEIIQPIHERFIEGIEKKYIDFFRQNVKYCLRLEQRAISYWDSYYRSRFHHYKEYTAVKALVALKAATEPLVDKPT